MSSKETPVKSREKVLAAREAKKLAKQKAKNKGEILQNEKEENTVYGTEKAINQNKSSPAENIIEKDHLILKKNVDTLPEIQVNKRSDKDINTPKSKDEVDRASVKENSIQIEANEKTKEQIKLERAARKTVKQAKKKGATEGGDAPAEKDLTIKDVVETLRDIVNVAKEVKEVTDKVSAIDFSGKKSEDVTTKELTGKSKAELRAERRAKQEAQRAAKQATLEQKALVKDVKLPAKPSGKTENASPTNEVVKEKSPKPKAKQKSKTKPQAKNGLRWLQNLNNDNSKKELENMTVNSNLHPAIIKLGVQLATRVVTGSNARCIALLDTLKKMLKDYILPAKSDFIRSFDAYLARSLKHLWYMRMPSVSQENAIRYFRHHLMQLPHNINEFDAKQILQKEIEKYITEQIDKAGQAISLTFQEQISEGDNIVTYGCSSLIERVLCETWDSGIHFTAVVVVNRVNRAGKELLRRLVNHGVSCMAIDINSVNCVMKTADKVVLGASAVAVNGSVVGAAGTALVALAARARRVPVLFACETHKFCDRVQTDAFVHNEIAYTDDLLMKCDDGTLGKDWQFAPGSVPLNLAYDVTPSRLVDAVITEVAMVPCTSAPILLRLKPNYNV